MPDAVHAEARRHLGERALVDLTTPVSTTNCWNRFAESFRRPAGDHQPPYLALPNARDAMRAARSFPTVRRLIARRRNQRTDGARHAPFSRRAYRERNRTERLVNRLEQHRRMPAGCKKPAGRHPALLVLGALPPWL